MDGTDTNSDSPTVPGAYDSNDGAMPRDLPAAAVGSSSSSQVGVATDRNSRWRRTMEDAHDFAQNFNNVEGQSYFGMFDGHAGKFAAEWCRDHMSKLLCDELDAHPATDVLEIMRDVFWKADEQLEAELERANARSGCTAVVSLVRPEAVEDASTPPRRVLYTANVGDARAILWCVHLIDAVGKGRRFV